MDFFLYCQSGQKCQTYPSKRAKSQQYAFFFFTETIFLLHRFYLSNTNFTQPLVVRSYLFPSLSSRQGTYRTFLELSNGHFTTESWAYSEGFWLFKKKDVGEKRSIPPAKSLFKNTMGSPILNFFKFLIKMFQEFFQYRNMGLLVLNLFSESVFNFGKWSN